MKHNTYYYNMGKQMPFENAYNNLSMAEAYARLEFPGCYYLAYRDLPDLIAQYVRGIRALDFGCGSGRSTRFLKKLGFDAIGADISNTMIQQARIFDPEGDYRLIQDGDLGSLGKIQFDLVQAIFTFDNIPGINHRVHLFKDIKSLLRPEGRVILVDATPEIYFFEWTSFSTRDFPENRLKKSGESVKIINTDIEHRRPVEDIIWWDEDYQAHFKQAGLKMILRHYTLARNDEPFDWVNETRIAPWVIYILTN